MNEVNLNSTKNILRSLINSAPTGLTVKDLERDFLQQEGRRIPFVELGYNRLITFLQSINDTLKIQQLYNGDYQVFAVQTKKSSHISELVSRQKNNKVPRNRPRNRAPKRPNTSAQMKTFYETCPQKAYNNMLNHPLHNKFSRNNNTSDVPNQLQTKRQTSMSSRPATTSLSVNYTSVIPAGMEADRSSDDFDFFKNDHEVPKNTLQKTTNGQCSNTSSIKTPPVDNSQINEVSSALEKVTIACTGPREALRLALNQKPKITQSLSNEEDAFSSVSTDETVTYATFIEIARWPKEVTEGSLLRVFITEINSPSKFWFHIQSDRHPLDFLMYNLEKLYTKMKPSEHLIHKTSVVPGLICAAFYLDYWHRGEIVRYVTGHDSAVVHFIDYGTTTTVKMENIKYLLSEFGTEPCQVYRGCLDCIEPIDKHWSRDATYAFLGLANDVMLYAKVMKLDFEEKVIRMLLINTHQEHDVQINVEMINRGLAKVSEEPINDTFSPKHRHPSERRPTFAQLESGSFPSFHMMGFLLMHNIDLNSIFDEIVEKHHVEDTKTIAAIASNFHPTNPFRSMLLTSSGSSGSNNESPSPPSGFNDVENCRSSNIPNWNNLKPMNDGTIGFLSMFC